MAINASIITDTAKEITKRTVVDYGAGVFAHTTQDWTKHNVVKVYPITYVSAGETISSQTLRILATLDDGSTQGLAVAVAIPLNSSGQSANTNSPPIIIQQPVSKTAPPNALVQLQVAVISDLVVAYQWYKKDATNVFQPIAGKTASNYVIPSASVADIGSYRVVATNANGSVTSNIVTITINSGATSEGDSNNFFEQLPPVRLFKFLSGLF